MNIIVVGCGKIGSTLVESLSAEGHDVVALEKDAHVLEQITNMYDVMGVCWHSTTRRTRPSTILPCWRRKTAPIPIPPPQVVRAFSVV